MDQQPDQQHPDRAPSDPLPSDVVRSDALLSDAVRSDAGRSGAVSSDAVSSDALQYDQPLTSRQPDPRQSDPDQSDQDQADQDQADYDRSDHDRSGRLAPDLAIGTRVRLRSQPRYLKTADPMPMLRPPDLLELGEVGTVVALRPLDQRAVRFERGTFLLAAADLIAVDSPASEGSAH